MQEGGRGDIGPHMQIFKKLVNTNALKLSSSTSTLLAKLGNYLREFKEASI
jgi:hypothetical protein